LKRVHTQWENNTKNDITNNISSTESKQKSVYGEIITYEIGKKVVLFFSQACKR